MNGFAFKYRAGLFAIWFGSFVTACSSTACEPIEPYSDEFALAPANGDGGVRPSAATLADDEASGASPCKRTQLPEAGPEPFDDQTDDEAAGAASGRLTAVELVTLINLHASVHQIYNEVNDRVPPPRAALVVALKRLNEVPALLQSYDPVTKTVGLVDPELDEHLLAMKTELIEPSLFVNVLRGNLDRTALPALRSSLHEMTVLIENAVSSNDEMDRFARIITNLLRLVGVDRHDRVPPVPLALHIFADSTVRAEAGRAAEFVPAHFVGIGTDVRPASFVNDDIEFELVHPYFGLGGSSYRAQEWESHVKNGYFSAVPLLFLRRLEQHSSHDDLRIVRFRQNGSGSNIDLPQDMRQAIVRYLSHDIRAIRNCFDFVSEVALPLPSYRHRDPAQPRFELLLSEIEFQPGDVVALLRLDESTNTPVPVHYALALGDGLYLSKMGTGKRLGVTRLASDLAGYGAQNFARVNLDSPEAIAEMFAALVK